jgi:hypothetical protein
MVFDNYDDPASFSNIRDYMPEGHYGDVLGTSRHLDTSELGLTDEHHFVELSGLEPVAASKLLLHHCRVQVGDESEVKTTLERLGYHALAITQAGAYIEKRHLSLPEFIDHFHRRKPIILETTTNLLQYRRKLHQNSREIAITSSQHGNFLFTNLNCR